MTPASYLNIHQARLSPCVHCGSAICCQLLVVENYPLLTLNDVDKTSFYLNFSNIEIILEGGNCSVYYSKPCRFLNTETHKCTVHAQPKQPSICVHYNPYTCFYKKAEADRTHIQNGFIWLDHARLAYLSEQFGFDEDRRIVKVPDNKEVIEHFNQSMPYSPELPEEPGEQEQPPTTLPYTSLCGECAGLCCKSLLFYTEQPYNEGGLDFCNYATGFPGVEYLVSNNRWAMLVDARCKYLNEKNQCAIADSEKRPLRCCFLNPQQCSIRQDITYPHQIRADYDTYNKLKAGIRTNEQGNVVSIEPIEELRKRIE